MPPKFLLRLFSSIKVAVHPSAVVAVGSVEMVRADQEDVESLLQLHQLNLLK